MNGGEELDEQTPNYVRRRFHECRCIDVERGGCWCEDDGGVSHGGVEVERAEHETGGYPRRAAMRVPVV